MTHLKTQHQVLRDHIFIKGKRASQQTWKYPRSCSRKNQLCWPHAAAFTAFVTWEHIKHGPGNTVSSPPSSPLQHENHTVRNKFRKHAPESSVWPLLASPLSSSNALSYWRSCWFVSFATLDLECIFLTALAKVERLINPFNQGERFSFLNSVFKSIWLERESCVYLNQNGAALSVRDKEQSRWLFFNSLVAPQSRVHSQAGTFWLKTTGNPENYTRGAWIPNLKQREKSIYQRWGSEPFQSRPESRRSRRRSRGKGRCVRPALGRWHCSAGNRPGEPAPSRRSAGGKAAAQNLRSGWETATEEQAAAEKGWSRVDRGITRAAAAGV